MGSAIAVYKLRSQSARDLPSYGNYIYRYQGIIALSPGQIATLLILLYFSTNPLQ